MPSFEHHGARIYYEEFGQGFPILTFAPAGLASVIKVWSEPSAPINPTTEFADEFRVIAMDQRNAGGQSRAPITAQDGWDSYTADHIALLDHLRIDRCHLYGQCIGGSFILNLIKQQPERVAAAVLAQPIGRVGPMPPAGRRGSRPGRTRSRTTPRPPRRCSTRSTAISTRRASSTASIATSCETVQTPCLVLAGNDEAHPYAIAEELSSCCRTASSSPSGRPGRRSKRRASRVKEFLLQHTPGRG